jgi:NAD(P)-dependent dehydrogenase (short-subunit alcohol dehydrogenase family)
MSTPKIDTAKLFDISGKVALVVGATGAFGQVAAVSLAGAGCRLALTGSNHEELENLKANLSKDVATPLAIARRPGTEAEATAMVDETVTHFGRLDILVVCAGMNDVAPIVDMSHERFERVMQANVDASWLAARAAARQMIAQGAGGRIVLTSSARGLLGHPAGYTAYCASKSAVDGITRALGCELGPHGITVNAIAPTVFRSPLTAWMFDDTERARTVRAQFLARVPVGRLGEPEDLAGPLLFLVSPGAAFYTGHILYADGGYTAG